jgi:hypothetical protein
MGQSDRVEFGQYSVGAIEPKAVISMHVAQ